MKQALHILALPAGIVAGLLCLLHIAGTAGAAPAAALTVTTFNDEVANNAQCSLREAITAANTDAAFDGCPAGALTDTIVLPAGVYVLTITGTNEINNANGNLDVSSSMIISGAGAASTFIEAGPTFNEGLFHVYGLSAVHVTLLGITLRNSHAGVAPLWNGANASLTISASAILSSSGSFAGAIHNQGDALTIANSRIAGNSSAAGAGGINDTGVMLTVTNSTLADNSSAAGAGGIYSQGQLTLMGSTVSHNSGHDGGGLEVANGTPNLIVNSTITANHAISVAGGIFNYLGNLTISNSLVMSNAAPLGGGIGNAGVMSIQGSHVMSNTAMRGAGIGNALLLDVQGGEIGYNTAGDIGGGIGNDGGTNYSPALIGIATLNYTLIDHNSAARGGGVGQAGYLTLTNSTLQFNTASVRGGGISIGNGNTILSATSIFSNSAPSGAGVFHTYEAQYGTLGTSSAFTATLIEGNATGGLTVISGTLRIAQSTLSGNAPNCTFTGGAVTSGGGNSSNDLSCASRFTGPGDINGLLKKLFLPLVRR